MNPVYWLKKSCAVALVGVLLTYTGSSFVLADEKSDLADRLEQAQQALEESEQKLSSAQDELKNQQTLGNNMRQDEQQLRSQINNLVGQISTTEAQIYSTQDAIAAKEAEIEEQKTKIQEQQERIDERWDDFKERVAAMQVMRSGGMLGMLANVTNLTSFLSFGDDLQQLSKKDRAVLDEMNAEKEKLEALETELEIQHDELEATMNELEIQRVNMESQQQQLENNKAQLAEQIKEQDKNIDAAAAEEQAAQAERDANYRIWVQAQAEYDKLANQGGGGSVIGDGSVMWPLPGYTRLSSVFGEDRWIWGVADTNHGGVDIPAPAGTPIHVFKSGTVYNSYYSASYGNVVMVDHGGGLVSIYAHMSSRAANVGDVVLVGDVIGYVGSTGQSTGNHLHFETRQNGVRVDPLGYVSPA